MTSLLVGPRVRLRKPAGSDAADIVRHGRDPEITKAYGANPDELPPLDLDAATSVLDALSAHPHAWVIEYDGRFSGQARLDNVDLTDLRATYAVGLNRAELLGQGLGAEVTRLVLDYAFGELGLHRVGLRVLANNTRAIRCYERSGFTHEGRERESTFVDGAWQDDLMMGILASEHLTTSAD